MQNQIHLTLGGNEVGQILDGLEIRAESWRKTADYVRTGDMGDEVSGFRAQR